MPKQSETCPHATRATANDHPSGSLQREQRAAQVCQKDTHLTGGLAPHAGQPQKSQTATPPVATTPIAYPNRLHASPALRSQARRLFHLFRLLSLGRRHAHVSNRLARGTPWQRVQRKVPAVRVVVWVMGIHSRRAVGRHDAAPGALPASTTLLRQPAQARSCMRGRKIEMMTSNRCSVSNRVPCTQPSIQKRAA